MISLCLRYLFARPRQTTLMILGYFFGTAAFVLLSGIMLGFRRYLVYQLLNNDAHIHIQPREDFLSDHSLDGSFFGGRLRHVFWSAPPSGRKDSAMVENPGAWYARLNADPRVVAYTPQLAAAVIFSKGKATQPATLIGCDPVQQLRVTSLGDYVVDGRFADIAAGGNRVALGDELRRRLGVVVSQTVMVSLASRPPTPFKVVACFKTGNVFFDDLAYGGLADVQAVNGTPNQVNEIAVRLSDYTKAARIAATWSSVSSESVQSWDRKNAHLFTVFRIQDAVRFLSIGAIMVVAGFGIYNVLNMTVVQKRRDVAILRSLGYSAADIVVLFFAQGMIFGVAGSILGLTFGYGMSFWLEKIPLGGDPITTGINHLLVSRAPIIYVESVLLALFSSCVASVLPARAAGRLPPIEIIRSGAE